MPAIQLLIIAVFMLLFFDEFTFLIVEDPFAAIAGSTFITGLLKTDFAQLSMLIKFFGVDHDLCSMTTF